MKTYLDPQDVELMEKRATPLWDRLLFHLGCRVSEVLAITLGDIDFKLGTIRILHLKTRSWLSCPHCKAKLARGIAFVQNAGKKQGKPLVAIRR